MTFKFKCHLLVCSIALLITSCSETDQTPPQTGKKSEEPLFSIVPASTSRINFQNVLKESLTMNGLFYEYFYNGAGVAVGDVNGDDLPDIYFVSNLKSNQLYLNRGNMRFEAITVPSNTKGKYGFPTGVTMVDINADGKLDIYICKSGKFNDPNKRRNELYINQGNNAQGIPVFKEEAKNYGLDLPHFSTQASFFDYDKDGDLDMFLLNHGISLYPDEAIEKFLNTESQFRGERLYRNDNGQFNDVSSEAGIINNLLGFGLGLAVGDINNDGWPDIITGHDYSEKDHIYLNQKNGTFKEIVHLAVNHVSNFSMGNDIADFNNDGWIDFISLDMMSEHNYDIKTSMSGMNPERFYHHVNLGLHHQYMYNALQLNIGVHDNYPRFSDIAQISGVSSTDWSWGPLFMDMDNDGLKDLFVANGIKGDFRNNDFVNYRKERQKHILKLKKEGKTFDQKAYVADILKRMPERKKLNYFYKNNGDYTFSSVELAQKDRIKTSSNGAAYADLDNDGDLDIVVNNSDDLSFIYKNNSRELALGNYIQIKLKGNDKNTLGIGARIIASYNGTEQIVEQYMSRGFQSSVSEILHIGIGDNEKIEKLKVIWNDGTVEIKQNVQANQLISFDQREAKKDDSTETKEEVWFNDMTKQANIDHRHQENIFDDFERESLLPHRMSQFGPALAVGDVNGDKMDDFYVGGAKGFEGVLYVQSNSGTFKPYPNPGFNQTAYYEDMGAVFSDVDLDGDLDLYVVSGGNEWEGRCTRITRSLVPK